MDSVSQSLMAAQNKAQALFDEVVAAALILPGKLESELTQDIHLLAESRFGLRRHWHKRIARSGPNTLLTYHDEATDRRGVQRTDATAIAEHRVGDQEMGMQVRIAR